MVTRGYLRMSSAMRIRDLRPCYPLSNYSNCLNGEGSSKQEGASSWLLVWWGSWRHESTGLHNFLAMPAFNWPCMGAEPLGCRADSTPAAKATTTYLGRQEAVGQISIAERPWKKEPAGEGWSRMLLCPLIFMYKLLCFPSSQFKCCVVLLI